jgi:hypothetical protein
MKGFGQQVQNQSYKSVYKQIELLVLGIKKQELTRNVQIFTTSPKRKNVLSQVVNEIAQKYPDCYLRVVMLDRKVPSVAIVPPNESFSYTWTELSESTGKWRVMAAPPGAWEYRCLTVWKDEERAREICESISSSIASMPLSDWEKKQGKFLELFKSLPLDDDSIVGLIDLESGKTLAFDKQVQEQLLPVFNQALTGDKNAMSQLDVALKQLKHEAL